MISTCLRNDLVDEKHHIHCFNIPNRMTSQQCRKSCGDLPLVLWIKNFSLQIEKFFFNLRGQSVDKSTSSWPCTLLIKCQIACHMNYAFNRPSRKTGLADAILNFFCFHQGYKHRFVVVVKWKWKVNCQRTLYERNHSFKTCMLIK